MIHIQIISSHQMSYIFKNKLTGQYLTIDENANLVYGTTFTNFVRGATMNNLMYSENYRFNIATPTSAILDGLPLKINKNPVIWNITSDGRISLPTSPQFGIGTIGITAVLSKSQTFFDVITSSYIGNTGPYPPDTEELVEGGTTGATLTIINPIPNGISTNGFASYGPQAPSTVTQKIYPEPPVIKYNDNNGTVETLDLTILWVIIAIIIFIMIMLSVFL